MKTKLTLSIDKDLVRFAHEQAKRNGRSVSREVSAYLRQRQAETEKSSIPSVNEMTGSLKGYKINDSKAGIRSAYAKKYLN